MASKIRYRLNSHHKFEDGGNKYVADLRTGDVIQVNDVEWDILEYYGTETEYAIVEKLKKRYKVVSIFKGLQRFERLGEQGSLLHPVTEVQRCGAAEAEAMDTRLKLSVPFHFRKEKLAIDYRTRLNRYQFLTHLAKFAELETLRISEACESDPKQRVPRDYGEGIQVRHVEVETGDVLGPPWYSMDGYDGLLLLSQTLTDDLLYYQLPGVPIVHCIGDDQRSQQMLPETLLTLSILQNAKDTLVVKSSWLKAWLDRLELPVDGVRVVPDGINVVEPIGKALAKQHTASIFEKPMFREQPIVGLISGFQPGYGAELITAFASANPHLSIFVYDTHLAEHYTDLPENVVIFSADSEEMDSVLPIFFQALDVVCFTAIPGTPLSLVLEAMAYGTACVALTEFGLPEEVEGAGVDMQVNRDGLGRFRVPMSAFSEAVNGVLKSTCDRSGYEHVAKQLAHRFTWTGAAEQVAELFHGQRGVERDAPETTRPLFPPVFCRQYDPGTGGVTTYAYRWQVNTYDYLETALAEALSVWHTPAEVASVFSHFQR